MSGIGFMQFYNLYFIGNLPSVRFIFFQMNVYLQSQFRGCTNPPGIQGIIAVTISKQKLFVFKRKGVRKVSKRCLRGLRRCPELVLCSFRTHISLSETVRKVSEGCLSEGVQKVSGGCQRVFRCPEVAARGCSKGVQSEGVWKVSGGC